MMHDSPRRRTATAAGNGKLSGTDRVMRPGSGKVRRGAACATDAYMFSASQSAA
jgi:hypothetical protein